MDTASRIQYYLEEHYALSRKGIQLRHNTLLLEKKIIDSVGMLELIGFVEKTFSITVPDEDISPEHFGTVEKITAYIARRQSQVEA